ncbi:hypothetical protein FF38_09205 [Lucilia cuprina]|uniref:Uncharacterized protein n=1 Tax=Lucilia cuprina TaxID=7375 RepID=A0A0L0BRA6_LUCCU|nr:hypothetical protein FF38_09205 [Lucilia cuprina]
MGSVVVKCLRLLTTVDGIGRKVADLETNIDKKADTDLESKLNNLQCQEGAVRIIPETFSRIKAPSFDSTKLFNVLKFLFDTVATRNMWNNEEKAIDLILALKGNASVVFESVPVSSRNNYYDIMETLQRKYGGEKKGIIPSGIAW